MLTGALQRKTNYKIYNVMIAVVSKLMEIFTSNCEYQLRIMNTDGYR